MSGLVALVGSGEFLPQMRETDEILLEGRPRTVVHLPTAAGQEGQASLDRWSRMATAHYAALGAEVTTLPVVDGASANDPSLAERITEAGLIYLSGGSPAYCSATLRDSLVWHAVVHAWEQGSSLAGCSAGACTLGAVAPTPGVGGTEQGLSIVPAVAVIPHYDKMRFLSPVFGRIMRNHAPVGCELIGIEEDTALVGRLNQAWKVVGRQAVVLLDRNKQRLNPGDSVSFGQE